jgi:hypothetical protein
MKKITIVAFDNYTDIDVFLAWDLFNRVRLIQKDWEVKIVGTEAKHTSVTGLASKCKVPLKIVKKLMLCFFPAVLVHAKLSKTLPISSGFISILRSK